MRHVMRKWIVALGAWFLMSVGVVAYAQQWLPGGTGTPIICGYNSSPPTATTGQYVLAQCDATGHLVTAASGGSGGSVTQGTVPWVVSNAGTFATQLTGATNNINNVAGTVSLPTGASTAALQSAVQGTAGTPAAAVVSVQGVSGGTTLPTTGAINTTATACSGNITSGGVAQNAFTAQTTLHGFTVANIDTTEPLWISFTTTAAASGTDSFPLQAAAATTFAGGGSFTAPPGFGLNHALSVIAATTSHKYSCTWW